jgi:hypothetical protein
MPALRRSWEVESAMRHVSLKGLCALVILLAVALSGCEYKQVTVRISDLEAAQVDGVRFWRLSETSGRFEPGGVIRFTEVGLLKGVETLFYSVLNADGSEGLTLSSPVARDPAHPDRVTLRIWYPRMEEEGWFKVTSFNAVGESSLSDEQIFL